ncbi:ATP-dependent DNA helicase PcrA [Aliarcobacter thereius]|uniref:UvrD-helicase domain-containing protein n=1 Tax=Aliarcobacter thereius TaxID=544718 RepID=UPI00082787AE|nr:ATP-dependent helicase [Aliarcobacter thereius]OCL85532.1 ATP-dependent DNA helicase PcrA [Aliarcobacter thereius]
MSLKNLNPQLLEEEEKIQKIINKHIDEFKHIKFNAGAGAGKTHSLKESLLYIIDKYGNKLKYHNQQILCITYTNVATDEIKKRIGNTTLIKVSTIHERIWRLIKDYQEELVSIHYEEVSRIFSKLNTEIDAYDEFKRLDEEEQNTFENSIVEKKHIFYKNKSKTKAILEELFSSEKEIYPDLFITKKLFIDLSDLIIKRNDIKKCKEGIEEKRKKFKELIYDSKRNRDSLHTMKISHDTLLDYGLKLIERYNILKKIIINKFPYILIDEYQDTADNIIKIISLLSSYSIQINYNLFIGYFGDTAQNIYGTGVGERIDEIHPNLITVNKDFNRRSSIQVINLINKIRSDEIQQRTIYEDADCGSVKFYEREQSEEESDSIIDRFIKKYKNEWQINSLNKLHCFVLKNELVAKYNGFGNIYKYFKKTTQYKGQRYQLLNTELVTYDLTKLGSIQSLFYSIIEFYQMLANSDNSISTILNKEIYKDFNLEDLFILIDQLKSISGDTMNDIITDIFIKYEKTHTKGYKEKVEELFKDLEVYTYDALIDFIFNKLYWDLEDSEVDDAKEVINSLLSLDISEYIEWFNFVNRFEVNDVLYHTYHGTKGLEFDNVIVIMENRFGLVSDKFSSFFSNSIKLLKKDEYINTKNLLYVACSRARKNLRILYLDDILGFRKGVQNIFEDTFIFDSEG